ncbi:phosphoribosylanthranilate isomerase [Fervidobacterium thailandense]|uniref:N-(5'-phosphoribosyl)anthranilate isomerase n=1 Tax=Fervidobacterium thailandense TaxID=1008305 RepID=A0A1E3G179_9BACT|nr:phosphoribosylanthranilate isomerase [Fervidobacterium thailandense]ODN30009.1 hypothetical protein A4H02_07470 [Fervidobacterium thailandense]
MHREDGFAVGYKNRVRVKICGITNLEDALLAVRLGADALGFIFYEKSPRYVSPEKALGIIERLPVFVSTVGVFVNERPEAVLNVMRALSLSFIQVYYDNADRYEELSQFVNSRHIIRPFRIKADEDVRWLVRSLNEVGHVSLKCFPLIEGFTEKYGGAGAKFDWSVLSELSIPFILAGGITPENVSEALRYGPYAIDVSSGVEERPGKKDPKKMIELFRRVGYDV